MVNIGGWFRDRVNDISAGLSRIGETLSGKASDYDEKQDKEINHNSQRINSVEKENYGQDLQIQKIRGDVQDLANTLGLDPSNLSAAAVKSRVNEINNDAGLTRLSDETRNTINLSSSLDGKQKKLLLDEINKLENAWKTKYQEDGSKFNLDDANTSNLISKLLATKDFVEQGDAKKAEDPNYKLDYVSGLASALRDTTNRIKSGLRAELPEPEGKKVLVTT